MKILIIGQNHERQTLSELVRESLDELGLTDIVTLSENDDESMKIELGITQNPAFCIEETSIDFRDMIFEWDIPAKSELLSLLTSIVGGESGTSCGGEGCDGCTGDCH